MRVFVGQERPPFLIWNDLENQYQKENIRMEEKKYYISLDGKEFEVGKELYTAYMKGQRKERYFTMT